MDEKKTIKSIATALVSQYGDDAQTVAMLRAAEFAAELTSGNRPSSQEGYRPKSARYI